jgi:hypothetical protein
MRAPQQDHEHHRRLVRAHQDATLLRALKNADPAKIQPAAIPAIVAAAGRPRPQDILRDYAPSLFAAGYNRGHLAGRLLMFVLACAEHEPEHANLEYAYHVFKQAFGKARLKGASRAYLTKAWSDYACVSHLWITLELWGACPTTSRGLADFLEHAESLRKLGEAHRPRKSPPLLDPAATWKMSDLFILPPWEGPLPTPAMLIESMQAWRDG